MGKLIIDGNCVYEVDEECMKRRPAPEGCRVQEAIERMERGETQQNWQKETQIDIKQ